MDKTAVRPASDRLRSVLDGFQSIDLGPSPALRRMAEQDRAPVQFSAAWAEVGQAMVRAIRAIVPLRAR